MAALHLGVSIDKLPGKSISILHPSIALTEWIFTKRHERFTAFHEINPDFIYSLPCFFVLWRVKIDHKGNRRVELKKRSGANGLKLVPPEFKQHDIGVSRGCVIQRRDAGYFWIGKDRTVEFSASFASLSNHKCGTIFCLVTFSYPPYWANMLHARTEIVHSGIAYPSLCGFTT